MNISVEIQKAAELREQGEFAAALKFLQLIIDECTKSNDFDDLYEAQLQTVLAHKHLFQHNHDITELAHAQAALSVAAEIFPLTTGTSEERSNLSFWFGEITLLEKKYVDAIEYYHRALEEISTQDYRRGDIEYHLGFAETLAGDLATGEKTIRQGIATLEQLSDLDEARIYNVKVWLSGAYLRLAAVLRAEEKTGEAQAALQSAQKIISSDSRLIIRQQQLDSLQAKFNQPTFHREDALF